MSLWYLAAGAGAFGLLLMAKKRGEAQVLPPPMPQPTGPSVTIPIQFPQIPVTGGVPHVMTAGVFPSITEAEAPLIVEQLVYTFHWLKFLSLKQGGYGSVIQMLYKPTQHGQVSTAPIQVHLGYRRFTINIQDVAPIMMD